jgi:hypothetical protein
VYTFSKSIPHLRNPSPTPVDDITWPTYTPSQRYYIALRPTPEIISDTDFAWPAASFWNEHIAELARYANVEEIMEQKVCVKNISPTPTNTPSHRHKYKQTNKLQSTTDEEYTYGDDDRARLSAYYRAWIALWILVAVIAILLWLLVACVALKRCTLLQVRLCVCVCISHNSIAGKTVRQYCCNKTTATCYSIILLIRFL